MTPKQRYEHKFHNVLRAARGLGVLKSSIFGGWTFDLGKKFGRVCKLRLIHLMGRERTRLGLK